MGKTVGTRDVAEMVRLRSEGFKPAEIATETKWNVNTVRHWLKKQDAKEAADATEGLPSTPDPGSSDDDAEDSDFGDEPAPDPIASPAPVQDGGLFTTDDDIFGGNEPGPRPVHELLDNVLARMSVTAEKRKNLVEMVKTTPQYSDAAGLFGFLTDMQVTGHKAKLIIEQVFGMKMFGDTSNIQNPMGPAFNMPGPMSPQSPGHMPPNMPGFPPQPQLQPQWDARTQQWYQPPPPYPNSAPQATGITQADLDRKLAEQKAETDRQTALDARFDNIDSKFNRIAGMIEDGGSNDAAYIEEVVPMLHPDGSPMFYPDSDKPMMKQVRRPAAQQSGEAAMMQNMFDRTMGMMKDQMTSRPVGPDPELEKQKEENRKLEADLREERLRKETAATMATLKESIAAERAETRTILQGVADLAGVPQGASDEVRIGLAKIESQTKIIGQGAGNVHETVKEGINLLKEVIKKPPPKGRDEVDQWTDEDLDFINS